MQKKNQAQVGRRGNKGALGAADVQQRPTKRQKDPILAVKERVADKFSIMVDFLVYTRQDVVQEHVEVARSESNGEYAQEHRGVKNAFNRAVHELN